MKKQICAMMLAGVMTVGCLAGCGSSSSNPAATGSASAGKGGDYKIALLMSHQSNAFTTAVSTGAKETGDKLGVTVDVFDGGQDQSKQASQVEQCISQGYDGIIIEPISTDGIVPAVKEANEAGIPVITCVQTMSRQDLAVAYCGGNDTNAGTLEMEKACEALGGKGNIVILQGPLGSDGQLLRENGYDAVLKKNPDIKVVFEDTANWTTDEALSKAETWLQTGTEINAFVCQNDSMALGAQKAIEDIGKENDILVFGVDAVEEGLDSIAKGGMTGTISQDAYGQGKLGVETMVDYLNGKDVEEISYTECVYIDSSNVADYQ